MYTMNRVNEKWHCKSKKGRYTHVCSYINAERYSESVHYTRLSSKFTYITLWNLFDKQRLSLLHHHD